MESELIPKELKKKSSVCISLIQHMSIRTDGSDESHRWLTMTILDSSAPDRRRKILVELEAYSWLPFTTSGLCTSASHPSFLLDLTFALQAFGHCGLGTSSLEITWELVRNAKFQPPPLTY